MKTALTLLTAAILPGGFIVLGLGCAAYLLARRRAARAAGKPADKTPLAAAAFTSP
jgi:hypothetical protein